MNCPVCEAENEAGSTTCVRCGASLEAATPTSVIVTIDLKPGTLFHGRYEIQGPLGRGGMGMVYRARDKTLDEDVAIKVLRPEFAEDPKMAERFKSEIKLARRIRHRNVCAIHDFGEDRGVLYISMELIDGVDLKHILKRRGALPPAEAYDVAIQVAEGLEAVHASGIIHRDLKTPNIMVDRGGVARLMDFGIAKRQEGGGASTATGHVLGTPEYMSPEQAQGQRVDARTDVYALGVVIYEIFTGDVPFRGETPISTILKHLQDPPPLDRTKLPKSLRPVLAKALAKEPGARYSNARAVADALREARTPSRKQQPIATEVLVAPTLPRPATRPARAGMQPWG
ncbi:MAG TPA: protein kinase, partial [Vicinamibacteria bacterium]|nr:protein kinase [Vicinamibacteria bacterium]